MSKRRNELESMTRQEPFAYRAAYDASYNVTHEGWAIPNSAEGSAVWLICKHTYDANNNLTKTEWATGADFNQIWTNYLTLSFS